MSFTVKILVGLCVGVAVGLFLGEIARPLSTGGDVFIGLLQMTVLPYIVVSLVGNLGRISWAERRGLLIAAISVMALLLVLGVVTLILSPLAFPSRDTASFFSASLVEQAKALDLVELYIPSNPFSSLANNVVPAVVLFSIMLGVGISGVPGNDGLLRGLDVLASGLNRINKMVIRATPVGVFAIAAGTAGTISVSEVSRLQAYVVTYTVVALILAFVVLPLLITCVTPFRYRDLIAIPRDTLITIFAAAKIIVVLPQLVENVKELFRRYELDDEDAESAADVLMPLAYPFPNLGTYAILMFVPFSAWYLGRSLDLSDHLAFHGASLLSSFVAPIIGIPFLLDILKIPADMMELFVISTVYTDRVRVVLGAMHLLSLTIVAVAIGRGVFRVDWMRLLRVSLLSAALLLIALSGIRAHLARSLETEQSTDTALLQMDRMKRPFHAAVSNESLPADDPAANDIGRLSAIEARGTLRVGFLKDSLPFAFTNNEGEVVGFDVDVAHYLARDLAVTLELVRARRENIDELFERGQIDIVMSGLSITPERARRWTFSEPTMDLTLAFLVPDARRSEFGSLESLEALPRLHLGVVQADDAFRAMLESHYPNAEIEFIQSPREFLRGKRPELDAVVYSAQGGSAWTLVYPNYSVAVPLPLIVEVPSAYPMPKGDLEWSSYVSEWVRLKRKDGTLQALFDHWILGGGAAERAPRWSIIRDVLHWID